MGTKKVVSSKVANLNKEVKKPTKPKKTVGTKKTASKKNLVCAMGEHCFWTNDGQVLKDLQDLEMAFKKMSAEVFSHHVNKDKNDFATWVETILEDANCAADLRKAKKASTAKTAVSKHLKSYAK